MPGLFVTLEGGEGTGKSTQARLLADALERRGHAVLRTREPGGTPGAERLRALLLAGDHGLVPRAEALLLFSARIDHVEQVLRPALTAGRIAICDRYHDSTLAYQGYGLGHGEPGLIEAIGRLIPLVGLDPDLTILLDAPLAVCRGRIAARGGPSDPYERLGDGFHERVAAAFRAIAASAPQRCVRICAADGVEAVHARVLAAVEARLCA